MPVTAALVQKSCFPELFTQSWKVHIAEPFIRRNGQLECGAFQVVDQNLKIVRLDVGMFGRVAEEIIGMLHDELIQRSR